MIVYPCTVCRARRARDLPTYGTRLLEMDAYVDHMLTMEPDRMQQALAVHNAGMVVYGPSDTATLGSLISNPGPDCCDIQDVPADRNINTDITPRWLEVMHQQVYTAYDVALAYHNELMALAEFEASQAKVTWAVARWHIEHEAEVEANLAGAVDRLAYVYCGIKQVIYMCTQVPRSDELWEGMELFEPQDA